MYALSAAFVKLGGLGEVQQCMAEADASLQQKALLLVLTPFWDLSLKALLQVQSRRSQNLLLHLLRQKQRHLPLLRQWLQRCTRFHLLCGSLSKKIILTQALFRRPARMAA